MMQKFKKKKKKEDLFSSREENTGFKLGLNFPKKNTQAQQTLAMITALEQLNVMSAWCSVTNYTGNRCTLGGSSPPLQK